MGKSDKKVKSDRINVLRKQYDAFLEEDKKRKERNDYILGRLDKMRSTTALVLRQRVSSVPKVIIEPPAYYNRPSSLKQQEHELQISRRNLSLVPMASSSSIIDEGDILRKISQKYILIPKLPNNIEEELPKEKISVENNDTDWKSKYDILAQLKKNEKESDDPIIEEVRTKLEKTDFPDRNDIFDTNVQPMSKRRMSIFPNEIPERDVSVGNNLHNKVKFYEGDKHDSNNMIYVPTESHEETASLLNDITNTYNTSDNNVGVYDTNPSNVDEVTFDNVPENDYSSGDKINDIPIQLNEETPMSYTEKKYDHSVEYSTMLHETLNQEDHTEILQQQQNPIQLEVQTKNDVVQHLGENNVNSVHMTSPEHMVQDTYVTNNIRPAHDVNNDKIDNYQYAEKGKQSNDSISSDTKPVSPHEIDVNQTGYVQEHEIEKELHQTHEEQLKYSEEIPIVDQRTLIDNQIDTVAGDTAEIEAVNQENNEMFHQEQANENYQDYQQPVEGEAYNSEYTADQVQYDPNTQCDPNAQYEGYEGTHTEQGYPAEYVDNEITQQQYDPTYEQQYATTEYNQQQQGYEQQPSELGQEPVQYEQQEGNYEQQPEQYLEEPEGFDQQQLQYDQQPGGYEQQPEQLVQQPGELQPGEYEQQGEYDQQQAVYEQNPELYEQPEQNQHQQVYDELPQEYLQQNITEPVQQQLDTEDVNVQQSAINQPTPAT